MITKTIEDITCTDSFKCSNTIVLDLEKSKSLKLYKRKATDPKPQGSVSILHTQNAHIITLEIYS